MCVRACLYSNRCEMTADGSCSPDANVPSVCHTSGRHSQRGEMDDVCGVLSSSASRRVYRELFMMPLRLGVRVCRHPSQKAQHGTSFHSIHIMMMMTHAQTAAGNILPHTHTLDDFCFHTVVVSSKRVPATNRSVKVKQTSPNTSRPTETRTP